MFAGEISISPHAIWDLLVTKTTALPPLEWTYEVDKATQQHTHHHINKNDNIFSGSPYDESLRCTIRVNVVCHLSP